MTKEWKCSVCGYIYKGKSPPDECPQCSSDKNEFLENKNKERLRYDGEKFDILLINGSSHKGHNTGHLADIAEKGLKNKKVSYKRFNLNEHKINHCWCCYSMKDNACTYPCRNQLDDMAAFHEMILTAKAVIICSPINWNNMSARLKDFLDRLTSIQNQTLLGKPSKTVNKTFGVLVNGHEDGGIKTCFDISLYFIEMGYILAPYSLAYFTHGAVHNAKTDNDYFKNNQKLTREVKGVVNNVVETMHQDLEKKLKNKITPVSE